VLNLLGCALHVVVVVVVVVVLLLLLLLVPVRRFAVPLRRP